MSKVNGKSFNGSPVSLIDDGRMYPSNGMPINDAIGNKDPRWDPYCIVAPLVEEVMEWLEEDKIWDGKKPELSERVLDNIADLVNDAVYKAFDLALDEVRQACNAFSMWPDEVEYPAKYLRDYKHP